MQTLDNFYELLASLLVTLTFWQQTAHEIECCRSSLVANAVTAKARPHFPGVTYASEAYTDINQSHRFFLGSAARSCNPRDTNAKVRTHQFLHPACHLFGNFG